MAKKNVNNISIHYQLEGEGKPIVFVHGLSDTLNYWNILINELKKDYQTLSFDLRGHGESSDDDRITTIDLYQEDLYHLLKSLNISNAVFIGLSLGGNIILDLAINHPEMVGGLVVMSSFCEMTPELKTIFDKFYDSIHISFEEFYDTILPFTLMEETIDKNRVALEKIKKNASKTANIEGISKGINAGYEFNIRDRLFMIDCPTIIICGEEDNLTDIEIQSKIHESIKDSEMILLERTKHNILISRNIEKVLDIIRDLMLKIE